MKIAIRKGMFETNSSSMHSLCITKSEEKFSPDEIRGSLYHYDKEDNWKLAWDTDDMNFGRYPFAMLTDFDERLRYIIAEYCGWEKDPKKNLDMIEDIIRKHCPDFTQLDLPKETIVEYILENGQKTTDNWKILEDEYDGNLYCHDDGKKIKVIDREWHNEPFYGDIDHQSSGMIKNFIKKENITLEDFIMNKRYIIIIDGDEYRVWDKHLNSGLIDKAFIDKLYPRSLEYYTNKEK